MRVIAKSALRAFWSEPGHDDAEQPLLAWHKEAEAANWASPADIKRQFGSASVLQAGRVVFNIGGNKFRLITAIKYQRRTVYVLKVMTHKQYDTEDWLNECHC